MDSPLSAQTNPYGAGLGRLGLSGITTGYVGGISRDVPAPSRPTDRFVMGHASEPAPYRERTTHDAAQGLQNGDQLRTRGAGTAVLADELPPAEMRAQVSHVT